MPILKACQSQLADFESWQERAHLAGFQKLFANSKVFALNRKEFINSI
jgi:hypothetical protein